MQKLSVTLLLLFTVIFFQFCSSTKKAAGTSEAPVASVTFEKDVKSIIETSCAPCHIAGQGRMKSLNNYADASNYINDIIARVQKNPGEPGFMPARHEKLSDATIKVLTDWKNAGLKEK